MVKISILMAIILLGAGEARADDIVRMRADGKMIDAGGNVIAIPATNDPQNTNFKKYYQSLDANGKPVATSDIYITSDPMKGLVKHTVNEKPTAAAQKTAAAKDGTTTKYSGTQTLQKDPNAPIYNDTNNQVQTLY